MNNRGPNLFWPGLLAISAGVIIFLVFFEIAIRAITPTKLQKRWSDRPYAYFMPSNSTILQDLPKSKKSPKVFRIITVGDSFTFGPHLQYQDTFPKRLETLLNMNVGAKKIEVFNQGISGSSTATESARISEVLKLNPDLVILEITLNDAEPKLLSHEEKELIYGDSHLHTGIFQSWKSLGFIARRFHNQKTKNNYIDYHTKYFKDPKTYTTFKNSLGSIKAKAATRNIPIIAVTFPLFDFPFDKRYPFEESHKIVSDTLSTLNIPEISLKGSYKNIPPERLQVIPGIDNHPNEIAHRIAAENILASLIDLNLIPQENKPKTFYKRRTEIRAAHMEPHLMLARAKRRTKRALDK